MSSNNQASSSSSIRSLPAIRRITAKTCEKKKQSNNLKKIIKLLKSEDKLVKKIRAEYECFKSRYENKIQDTDTLNCHLSIKFIKFKLY